MPTLEELVPVSHIVRIVSGAIDGMDLDKLLKAYKGGGSSTYHPKMLLKVLVYGYIDRLYSSRRLEKATRENVNFMWSQIIIIIFRMKVTKMIIVQRRLARSMWFCLI